VLARLEEFNRLRREIRNLIEQTNSFHLLTNYFTETWASIKQRDVLKWVLGQDENFVGSPQQLDNEFSSLAEEGDKVRGLIDDARAKWKKDVDDSEEVKRDEKERVALGEAVDQALRIAKVKGAY